MFSGITAPEWLLQIKCTGGFYEQVCAAGFPALRVLRDLFELAGVGATVFSARKSRCVAGTIRPEKRFTSPDQHGSCGKLERLFAKKWI